MILVSKECCLLHSERGVVKLVSVNKNVYFVFGKVGSVFQHFYCKQLVKVLKLCLKSIVVNAGATFP